MQNLVQSISHIAHKAFTSALVLIDHKIPDSPLCRLVLLLAATTMNTARLTQQHAHCLLRLCEIKLTGSATAVLPTSFPACLMHKSQTTWCHKHPQVSTVSAYKEMRAPAKMTGSNHSASSLRLSLFDPGTASLPPAPTNCYVQQLSRPSQQHRWCLVCLELPSPTAK